MHIFPKVETPRLILNELRSEDIPTIAKYASNKKLSEFTLNLPHPYSDKVMQKNGMIKEGELKEHILKNNEYHGLILYGITKNAYFGKSV